MPTALLRAEGLRFSFRDSTALFSDLDLSIGPGSRMALLGPTGCGKSVLLKILSSLLRPSQGTLSFEGRSLNGDVLTEYRRYIGMTFQKDGLFDSLSCGDNLRLPLWEVERVSGKRSEERVQGALTAVGLEGQADMKVYQLSGGMQKRLGIARALLFRPKLIFYDEPTAGLDPITSRTILRLIESRQKDSESAVLIVTSQPEQVEPITDSVAFLWQGRLEGPMSWHELRDRGSEAVQQFIQGGLKGPLTARAEGGA